MGIIDSIINIVIVSYLITGFIYYLRTLYIIFNLSKEEYEEGLENDIYPELRYIPLKKQITELILTGITTIFIFPYLIHLNNKLS